MPWPQAAEYSTITNKPIVQYFIRKTPTVYAAIALGQGRLGSRSDLGRAWFLRCVNSAHTELHRCLPVI